ncbi:dTDP-4-dehydrorhamnose reductase [Tsuneonella amylolytica]|uniref:dTDP-4-dehydrorhamnose reductase n=1 Tax=Tsuneonella amylolytica TaxID=2338327 RepID=UPI000EAAA096|nr:dTDP-4-dehydrorhamnose reductase [Tsuneonella amylolytica]
MKVLITGARGQLGMALLASVPDGLTAIPCDRQNLDLGDGHAIRQFVQTESPDLIINAAAYTAVDLAETHPDEACRINSIAPGILAEASRRAGASMVHISTDFVFDGLRSTPYKPDDARNPLSVYGETKAGGEDAVVDHAAILRTSWVYSLDGANFVNTMLQLMSSRDELKVVADQIGAPTYSPNLADVIWRLALRRGRGIWHYSDAGAASWYDFAVAIQEEALTVGRLTREIPIYPITTDEFPTAAKRPRYSLLDSNETRATLDVPAVHWRKNLRRMMRDSRM